MVRDMNPTRSHFLLTDGGLRPLVLGHGKTKRIRIQDTILALFLWIKNEVIARPYITICKTGGYCYGSKAIIAGDFIALARAYLNI